METELELFFFFFLRTFRHGSELEDQEEPILTKSSLVVMYDRVIPVLGTQPFKCVRAPYTEDTGVLLCRINSELLILRLRGVKIDSPVT